MVFFTCNTKINVLKVKKVKKTRQGLQTLNHRLSLQHLFGCPTLAQSLKGHIPAMYHVSCAVCYVPCAMCHVPNSISRSCYASLYSLSRVRKYLTEDAVKTLVHAFVANRLDNFNSLLTGLPLHIINRLQSIQNSAVQLITKTKKHDHITGVLQALHWLPVEARIHYQILL